MTKLILFLASELLFKWFTGKHFFMKKSKNKNERKQNNSKPALKFLVLVVGSCQKLVFKICGSYFLHAIIYVLVKYLL